MKSAVRLFVFTLVVFVSGREARAQVGSRKKSDVYHFGQANNQPVKKLTKLMPGRLHLLDGSTRSLPLAYVDYNQLVALENGVEKVYTPLEVSSFMMKQDSFVVLKDFSIKIEKDEQEYGIAFVQVGVVGPNFTLYKFTGTMRREESGYLVMGANGMASGQVPESTRYRMTKAWLMHVDGNSQVMALPASGPGIANIVAPLVADDKHLVRSLKQSYVTDEDVEAILRQYLVRKSTTAKE